MINMNAQYLDTLEAVAKQIPFEPEICIVLGSGLGDFAKKVETVKSISTSSLPIIQDQLFKVIKGIFTFQIIRIKNLLIVQGRIHFYEGYTLSQCLLPVHIASKLNCSKIILTNAAGGVNPNFKPGDLMLATSLNGVNIKTN